MTAAEEKRLASTTVRAADLNAVTAKEGLPPVEKGGTAAQLLRRPELTYDHIEAVIGPGEGVDSRMAGRIVTEIKYEGYIARQQRVIRETKRLEGQPIPADFDYAPLEGLRLEAREKLQKLRPADIAAASRIPGVSPADIAVLSVAVAAAGAGPGKETEDSQ